MLKNYIKIAWRNLRRNKSYSLINTVGLSVGIASCLLIFLFIQDELSYDRYHENSERIYRVYEYLSDGERTKEDVHSSNLLAPTLEEEIAGIENSMRLNAWGEVLVEEGNNKFYEENFFSADPSIFEIFSVRMLRGNPETALNGPFKVILSEEMALKYFGESDPVGQTLAISDGGEAEQYEVTGVMENTPHNSHFSMNFLTSYETLRAKSSRPSGQFENWRERGDGTYTYVLLSPQVTAEELADDLREFYARHHRTMEGVTMEYRLQPVTDIHLYSSFEHEIEPGGSPGYLYIFSSIALLILGIAGINYMNLATARSADRAMEVGIRKTLGVSRSRLMIQFLSESLMFCLISLILALFLAEALLPFFNDLVGKPLSLEVFNPTFLLILVGVLVVIGLLAGLYPAFVLSRFNPGHVFRGAAGGRRKSSLRNALVVFQFSVSIVLIIGTFVIAGQLDHVRDRQLGLNDEQVVTLSTGAGIDFGGNFDAFKDRLLSYPAIESVTYGGALPYTREMAMSLTPVNTDVNQVNIISVGPDYLRTLEIPLKEGQDISDLPGRMEDVSAEEYIPVLINEAAVEAWGWEEPLGKRITGINPNFRVVGVVEDFHYRSMKEEITPLIIWSRSSVNSVLIRMSTDDVRETLASIEEIWNELGPGTPMDYTFLDDRFDALYQADDRLASLFGSFSMLAIIIACMGLFGLAAHTAESRIKEIGIRKVLGATVANIVGLLSKDFLKLVLLGFVIAVPVAWYAMNQWLAEFAYRIEIGAGIFLLAGGAAVLIALVTVSWQSIRAALANPVDSLRSE